MATQSRTLKLSILAETKQLADALKGSQKNVESFGDQLTDFGKKAALAFAAAGAAIGAFALKSVQNAAADEGAQRKLTETLQKTTNATTAQIAAVGQYIDKTSIAIGVTDDELRPAFSRLARSTNDVQAAQDLLNLALDVSSATGKPLEAVANALGKAYDGNAASLGRLGLGIDQSTLKSGNFNDIFKQLTGTFGGFAANEAQTTEKSFVRIKIAIDEAQERIGAALLPLTEKLTTFILNNVVPALNAFVGGLTGDQGVSDAFTESEKNAFAWGERVKSVIKTVIDLKDELIVLAGIIGTIFVVSKISAAVTGTIAAITALVKAYNALKASAIVAGVATYFALNPLAGVAAAAIAAGVLAAANNLISRSDIDVGNFDIGSATGNGSNFNFGAGNPSFSGGSGGTGSGGTGSGGTGGSNRTGGGDDSFDTLLKKLKSDTDKAQKALKDATEKSFNLQNSLILNNATAFANDPDFLKSQRLAELGFQSQLRDDPEASKLIAERARLQGTTNITVNMGVVGDPEAAKRAIIDLQNEGFYRGTGGGNLLQGLK
jgi:hypothetical protein